MLEAMLRLILNKIGYKPSMLLKKYWAQVLLLAIGVVACITNYAPGTFLSGWDTLHPEFNFPLAFSRAIFGVFRPEQGVGAVAAHSQMADLPHILISYMLYAISNMQMVRYLFIFLCFVMGGVGMYALLRHLIPTKAACFVGALFYMCNIGTVQNFYVPFEMFVVQYASLPFLFLFSTDFLFTKKHRSLLYFSITVILSSPMAYAATLWYVTFCVLLSYLSILSYLKKSFSRFLILAVFMLLLNLYWILPNLYFVLYHGKDVQEALTNQLFSEEAFLYNKTFGNVGDIATLHTFYFDWSMYANHTFVPLMQAWTNYLDNSFQKFLALLFFSFSLFGLGNAVYKKKKILLSFLPAIGLCLLFLFNDNLPFHAYGFLEKIPLFQEAFRFPDDKILGVYVFLYTIFFTFGLFKIVSFTKKISTKVMGFPPHFILYPLSFILIVLSSFPMFQGQLISPAMRVHIPQEYFQLFSYLNSQPQGRIATLPMQYLWGWQYYDWHYQGSGFLSYGIPQAIMDRDFDRWNGSNETYYREMSYALYTQNAPLLSQVLEKYNISSILLDTSVVDPTEGKNALWYAPTQQLLQHLGLHPVAFGTHLFLYLVPTSTKSVVALSGHVPSHSGTISDVVDKNFSESGDYITKSSLADFSLTHLGFITNASSIAHAPLPFASYHLFTPSFLATTASSYTSNDCAFNPLFLHTVAQTWEKQLFFGYIRYISQNGSLCDHVSFPYPLEGYNYILQITARNILGLSLRICVSDPASGKCIIYTKLPLSHEFTTYNIFLPAFSGNKRFAVNINTIGIPGTESINDIRDIRVLSGPRYLSFLTPSIQRIPITTAAIANTSMIAFASPPTRHITLFLAYDPGWQLYKIANSQYPIANSQLVLPFLFSSPVGKHVEIDTWANGWELQNSQSSITNDQFVIIFMPQYLEYFGFLILIVTILLLIIY